MKLTKKKKKGRKGKGSTYINLAQNWKTNAIIHLAKLLNLLICSRVLTAELVAWETDDLKVIRVFRFDVLIEFLEAFKLRREAAFGGRVYDEDDFIGELGEVVGLALFCEGTWVSVEA